MITGKLVHFKYTKFDGSKSVRSLKPRQFQTVGNFLCITGHCFLRGSNRTFAVQRMSSLKILSAPGRPHDVR